MFGRVFGQHQMTPEADAPRGFDSFELKLGDVMRGERATLGKSLLDVQRELRIKAAYIAAIESCDTAAFETQGFIAGYVRSYARYLGMEPESTFERFCEESGFRGVHGPKLGAKPEGARDAVIAAPLKGGPSDVIANARGPFVPQGSSSFSAVDPGALGSIAVLFAVVAGLGFGGWTLLQEIQQVQMAPVEDAPEIVAQITDPLEGALAAPAVGVAGRQAPSLDDLDRLYRPDVLEPPVVVARDAPISTIRPGEFGALAGPDAASVQTASATPLNPNPSFGPVTPEVTVAEAPVSNAVTIFAVRPAWVRVTAAEGSVIFEKILDAGETYVVPETEAPASLHAGNSGSVYFRIGNETFGPAGSGTSVARGVLVAADPVRAEYALADPETDRDLATVVAALSTAPETPAQE